ncbi:hypothetical protein DAH55_02295 [Sphingomonas koreensis]|nr:hypothetical protein DAH56_15795 [Sphingomonas koreensis]RSU71889.1 hypothetical protein DAH55_02295 [Sphingomonas koreensis]
MKLPRWYTYMCAIWAIAAPSFWWLATGLGGLPFFSLPELAGPSSGAGWQIGLAVQIMVFALLLAPITALPFVFWNRDRY